MIEIFEKERYYDDSPYTGKCYMCPTYMRKDGKEVFMLMFDCDGEVQRQVDFKIARLAQRLAASGGKTTTVYCVDIRVKSTGNTVKTILETDDHDCAYRMVDEYEAIRSKRKRKTDRRVNACRARKSTIISAKKPRIIRRKFVERVS